MTCSNCGVDIKTGSRFCKRCGAPVGSIDSEFQFESHSDSSISNYIRKNSNINSDPVRQRHLHRRETTTFDKSLSRTNLNKSTIYMIVGIGVFVALLMISSIVIVKYQKRSELIPAQSISAPMVEKTTQDSDAIEAKSDKDTINTTVSSEIASNESASSEASFDEEVYRKFIDNERYLVTGDVYYNDSDELGYYYEPISYALYDMDRDGNPELFVTNGGASYADVVIYVYGYYKNKPGEMVYIGMIPGSSDMLRHGNQDAFPGIFMDDAHTGSSWTNYYSLVAYPDGGGGIIEENVITYEELMDESGWTGEREETSRTSINGLFEANENSNISIVFTSKDDYNTIGWDGFVEKCGYSSLTSNVPNSNVSTIVPNLIGLTVQEASDALTSAGLTAKATYEKSDLYDKDYIVGQDIAPGTDIEKGAVIKLTVSSGK